MANYVCRMPNAECRYRVVESSMDHLETKRQILELRAKFGQENWLSSRGGTFIQNIMGLDTSAETMSTSISPTLASGFCHYDVGEKSIDAIEESAKSAWIRDAEGQADDASSRDVDDIANAAAESKVNLESVRVTYDPEEG